jgi:NDP-sugar pyrophosphorylase family protein
MKAILLAGGKGTRLRPLTVHTPKPIVPILNRPFLYYQIDLLKQVPEIDEVILSLNYQPRRIEEVFGEGEGLGVRLRYVVEPMPLGTAGAVRYAGDALKESVVVFNGDVLTEVDLAAVLRLHRERNAKATIVLTPVENPRAYGLVETDSHGNVKRFLEKPGEDEITCNTINAGIYVLEPDTFDRIPKDTAWSIERSFFPSLIERGETFVAYVYDGYWIDIGTPAKYLQVHRDIMDGRYSAPPFGVGVAVGARRCGRPGPRAVLCRRGGGGESGRAHPALLRRRPADARRRRRDDRQLDRLAERMDRSGSRDPRIDSRPELPRRAERRGRIRGRARRQDGHHRLQPPLRRLT